MERSLLNEITDPRLKAYVKNNPFAATYWPSFLDLDYRDELTWESLQGEVGSSILADVIEYDSSAPEKGREVIDKASGKINKIAVKRSMKETDFLQYHKLKKGSGNDEKKKKILNLVFGDVDFVNNAVNSRVDWLFLQALSLGRIVLDKKNNNGKVTEKAISYGIPTENRTFVDAKWSDKTNGKPIANIKDKVKAARKKGVKLNYILMDPDTFDYMTATSEVKGEYGFFISKSKVDAQGNISLDDMNSYLGKNRLPQIKIIESYQRIEDKDGKRDVIQPWATGYVTFVTDVKVGKLQHGPIIEEEVEAAKKKAIQAKKGHILTTKWATLDPVKEWTKGEANCFPVLENPEDIFMLNTENTTKFYV